MSELMRAMLPRILREMLTDALRGLLAGEVVHRVPLKAAKVCAAPCETIHAEQNCPACGSEAGLWLAPTLAAKAAPEEEFTNAYHPSGGLCTDTECTDRHVRVDPDRGKTFDTNPAPGRKAKVYLTDDQRKEAVALVKGGESQLAVSKLYNVSQSAISRFVKEAR